MIDLHMHTNYSDGTDNVLELLRKTETKKLEVISITDHDSVEAYYELESIDINKIFSGRIIVGTEMKAYYNGIPVEVLGYGIDYRKIKFKEKDTFLIQSNCLEEFKKRGKKLGLVFDENISVSKTDPAKMFAAFTFATEILKYDENKDILLSIGPMFDASSFYRVHASNKNSIFYYDESSFGVSLEEAIDMIHMAGGLAFLAHPLVYPYDGDKFIEIERILTSYDLDGLECEYPLFSVDDREKLKSIAIRHNKYLSGGTDYHAKNKPNISMGTGIDGNMNIQIELIEEWVDKISFMNLDKKVMVKKEIGE